MSNKRSGRPTLFAPVEHPMVAERVTGMGGTMMDVAKALGVARSTVILWAKEHPTFSVAIQGGRADAADRVERSLFERAIGYTYKIEKIVVIPQGAGLSSRVERVEMTVHCPPDTAAIRFFLTNRRPKEWRERHEVAVGSLSDLAVRLSRARKRLEAPRLPLLPQ